MDESEIKDRAASLLEELFAFGVDRNTVERVIRGAVAAERELCEEKKRVPKDPPSRRASYSAKSQLGMSEMAPLSMTAEMRSNSCSWDTA